MINCENICDQFTEKKASLIYVLLCLPLSYVWLFAASWTVASQAPLFMGIFQARVLEWVAMSFSRGSSQPRDRTQVSCIAGGFFTVWASREALIIIWTPTIQ